MSLCFVVSFFGYPKVESCFLVSDCNGCFFLSRYRLPLAILRSASESLGLAYSLFNWYMESRWMVCFSQTN